MSEEDEKIGAALDAEEKQEVEITANGKQSVAVIENTKPESRGGFRRWLVNNSSVCWGAMSVGLFGIVVTIVLSSTQLAVQGMISKRENQIQEKISARVDATERLSIALNILRTDSLDKEGNLKARTPFQMQLRMWAGKEFLIQTGAYPEKEVNGMLVPDKFMQAIRDGEDFGKYFGDSDNGSYTNPKYYADDYSDAGYNTGYYSDDNSPTKEGPTKKASEDDKED